MYTHVFLFNALFKLRRLKCFIRVSVAVVEAKGLQNTNLVTVSMPGANVKLTYTGSSQGRTKGRTSRAAALGAKCHWNNRKCDASKLRFPHAKEFFRKLTAIWSRGLQNFRQPCHTPKKFKEYLS
jgi:hypothetical protein